MAEGSESDEVSRLLKVIKIGLDTIQKEMDLLKQENEALRMELEHLREQEDLQEPAG